MRGETEGTAIFISPVTIRVADVIGKIVVSAAQTGEPMLRVKFYI